MLCMKGAKSNEPPNMGWSACVLTGDGGNLQGAGQGQGEAEQRISESISGPLPLQDQCGSDRGVMKTSL